MQPLGLEHQNTKDTWRKGYWFLSTWEIINMKIWKYSHSTVTKNFAVCPLQKGITKPPKQPMAKCMASTHHKNTLKKPQDTFQNPPTETWIIINTCTFNLTKYIQLQNFWNIPKYNIHKRTINLTVKEQEGCSCLLNNGHIGQGHMYHQGLEEDTQGQCKQYPTYTDKHSRIMQHKLL